MAIGLAAYALALVAMLPARLIARAGPRWAVAGTVWHGEAVRDGRYRIDWRWAPLRSIAALGFAADVTVSGDGTDLAAAAVAGPHRLILAHVTGRADAGLLGLIAPLPFACDGTMQVDVPRLMLAHGRGEAVGEVRIDDARCGPAGAATARVPVPPLLLRAVPGPDRSTAIALAPIGQGRRHWLEGSIAGGRASAHITAEGARALPFARGWRFDRALSPVIAPPDH